MTKQHIFISALMTFGFFTNVIAFETGPMLPKPILIPVTIGDITVKTLTIGEVNTHVLVIDDEAARPLFNSLQAAPGNKQPQAKLAEENRIGRNIKCVSRITTVGSKQKISCELSISDGEYLDLLASQIPETKSHTVKITTATVRTQARADGVQMTIVGMMPKSKAANEIYDSLNVSEIDSTKTKNMISCSKTPNTSEPIVTCTTVFKDGVALLAPVKN